jgi:hypothetical protein
MLIFLALLFLVLALVAAGVGVNASWDQGLPAIMYWLAGVSLLCALLSTLAHVSVRQLSD